MGGPSWQFKRFADVSSRVWGSQGWKDKIAAGFTNSATINGDKLSTLHYFFTLAMQHSMLWVGTGLMPSNKKSARITSYNVCYTKLLRFTSTQRDADWLADRLAELGHAVASLHGGMPQGRRNRVLQGLRTRHLRVLVATDVAARGIDVPTISHVINYGLPMKAEDYVV